MYLRLGLHVQVTLYYVLPCKAASLHQDVRVLFSYTMEDMSTDGAFLSGIHLTLAEAHRNPERM